MPAESWFRRLLLTIARQTPDYRAANLDWRANLLSGRTGNVVRRWLGAIISALIAGIAAISLGAYGLGQASGREPQVHIGTPSATATAVSASPAGSEAPVVQPTAGASGSGGGFSSMLIVVGAVLVLLGVGAIGLILWRRKAGGAPEGEGPWPPRRGPKPVPNRPR